jgi:hypothetical protein
MAEEKPDANKALDTLTADEIKIIARAIKRVEQDVFEDVIRRLKVVVILIAGVLTVFGVASLTTVKNATVDTAASKIAADTAVRDEVVAAAVERLESVNAVLRKSAELEKKVETEQARALTIVSEDLKRLLDMTQQLEQDLSPSTEASDENH